MSDESTTAVLPKADRISMTAATTGEGTYLLHFPESPDGATVGRIITEVSAVLPGMYFHFNTSGADRHNVAIHNRIVAMTPENAATVEELETLIGMFRPDIYLIGLAQIQAGQRSFEVTMTVMNFGADTPADKYRELVTKLQTVPGVTEVMWDGEREIFMLVSGKKKLVYTKWAEDVATIAGISIRSSRAHNSPVGVMLSSLLDCGHDHH